MNRRQLAGMTNRVRKQNEALHKLASRYMPYLVITAILGGLFAFNIVKDERARHQFEAKVVARHVAEAATPAVNWRYEYVSDAELKAQHEATAKLLRHDNDIAEGRQQPTEGPPCCADTTGP